MLWWFDRGAGDVPVATREGFAELTGLVGRGSHRTDLRSLSTSEASAVIKFWADAGPREWFGKRPDFDRSFRERFLSLYERVARLEQGRTDSPDESLALLLLLDQFPRNAFRGTARMYATDVLARTVADAALGAEHDRVFEADLKLFFCLPFGHSESLADQDRAVALAASLPEPAPSHSRRHRDIILRFGRFPHRNPILGRAMTAEEQLFLDEGGYAG